MLTKKIFYVYDFCAPEKTDSDSIKRCLSAAGCHRQKTIVFDRRDWHIDEAILLPSGTTVIIDGCSIIQNDEVFDNVFRGDNLILNESAPFGRPLSVLPIENIKILGKNGAKIIGCNKNRQGFHPVLKEMQEMTGDFWGWRTLQISFSLCENIEISGLAFEKSRCWAMSFDHCHGGYIHDLHITSHVKNGDGVDIRAGCYNFIIETISGFTSDDTVACSALPTHDYPYINYLYPLEPSRRITENPHSMDIHDITIRNITTGGHHHGIICLAAGGLLIYNIIIENICEDNVGEREATVKIYTGYGNGYLNNDLHNISVRRVSSRIAKYAFLCNAKVSDVVLSELSIENENQELFSIAENEGITII